MSTWPYLTLFIQNVGLCVLVATTTFATEIETNTASGKTNQLVTNALDLFNLNPFRAICFLGGKRWFNDLVGIHMGFTERAFDYFAKLTKSILKQRRESRGKRGDLVQLLMDAYVYENDLKNASYENLTANTEQEGRTIWQQTCFKNLTKIFYFCRINRRSTQGSYRAEL